MAHLDPRWRLLALGLRPPTTAHSDDPDSDEAFEPNRTAAPSCPEHATAAASTAPEHTAAAALSGMASSPASAHTASPAPASPEPSDSARVLASLKHLKQPDDTKLRIHADTETVLSVD